MIETGVPFQLDLSVDEYHDKIDPAVFERFKVGHVRRERREADGFTTYWKRAGVRTPSRIYKAGAAARNEVYTAGDDVCCCPLPLGAPATDDQLVVQ